MSKKKLDICSFKCPIIIREVEQEDGSIKKVAEFDEVEMADLCFDIETIETETSVEAMNKARELSEDNNKVLAMYARSKETGFIGVRKVMCEHGRIKVNSELNINN